MEYLLKRTGKEEDSIKTKAMILSLLDPDSFINENILVTSKLKFTVIFDSLITYNKRILLAITLLKNNSVISADWCSYDYKRVSYDIFFSDGVVYLDKQKEIGEFIRLVKELRQQIYNIKDAQVGPQGHNLRQMSRFHTHLSDLIVELIRGSHEISLSEPS